MISSETVFAKKEDSDRNADWKRIGSPVVSSDPESFRVGDKVKHPKFGSGIVMAVKGSGKQAELTVVFKGEVKKLLAEYAKLVKLK